MHADHLEVRALEATDSDEIAALFARLSPVSRYRRYFSPMPKLPAATLRHLTSIDHHDHEAVGAFDGEELIASAHYFRSPNDPSIADLSIEVADSHQRHGIARRLVRELIALACGSGVRRLHADVLGDNRAALALLSAASDGVRSHVESGSVSVDIPLRCGTC